MPETLYIGDPKPSAWATVPSRRYGRLACCLDADGAVVDYPTHFSELVGWLKADKPGFTAPVYGDGTQVGDADTIWFDLSGNGHSASKIGVFAKPSYETNEVNGKPVIRFDTLQEQLDFPELTFSGDFTVIFAGRTTVAQDTVWLGHDALNHQLRRNRAGVDIASFADGAEYLSSTWAGPSSDFMMMTWRRTGTTLDFRQNKTDRGNATETPLTTVKFNTICNNLFIGSGRGDLGEVVYYNIARANAELDLLYDKYYKLRWALP